LTQASTNISLCSRILSSIHFWRLRYSLHKRKIHQMLFCHGYQY
jgi:hypothetical protein